MSWTWVPVVAFPLLCAFTVWQWLRMDATRRSWPSVMGRVTGSEVQKAIRSDDEDGLYKYRANIEYRYEVGQRTYLGHRVGWLDGEGWGSERDAAATVWRYRSGKVVRVHYDPQAPQQSVLEFSDRPLLRTLLVGSLSILLLWVVLEFEMWRA